METRGAVASVPSEPPVSKEVSTPTPTPTPALQRQKLKQPGVSYRATLQKLSNTISLSSAEILERYEKAEPSLTLHFYKSHWKFEHQDGVFLYSSPARQILECIRNEQIPVDCLEVFRDVKIRYYEGCLILKLVDNREDPPTILHTALRPSPESIWTEMLLYSEQTQGNFTDLKALQVESDILVATNPPLDLTPVIHPAHSALRLSDLKDPPLPRAKRKRESRHEDDEEQRMMYLYDERHGREFAPDFKRLAFVEAHRKKRQMQQQKTAQAQAQAQAQAHGEGGNATAPAKGTGSNLNGHLKKTTAQSPVVGVHQSSPQAQASAVAGGTGGTVPDRPSIAQHLQSRPSASPGPGPGPRQVLNQQALAQHLAQQGVAMPNGVSGGGGGVAVASPRLGQSMSNGSPQMVTDLARQQQIMLQQRAIAIRNLNAARAAQQNASNLNHNAGASPRPKNNNPNGNNNNNNNNGNNNVAGAGGLVHTAQQMQGQMGIQGTPTPLQMQQIRQMQAQQQQQQMLAAQQQAAQNAQFQQMR